MQAGTSDLKNLVFSVQVLRMRFGSESNLDGSVGTHNGPCPMASEALEMSSQEKMSLLLSYMVVVSHVIREKIEWIDRGNRRNA
jgi:hypothetical protein